MTTKKQLVEHVLSFRIEDVDKNALDRIQSLKYPLLKKSAVAREIFRRGLETLMADGYFVDKKEGVE